MHIKTATISALVALALAGCDSAKSPAGAGADASSGTGTGRAEAVSRTTDIGSSKEKAITSETPVLPLLVRSVRGLTPDPDNAGQYMAGVCSLQMGFA